MQLPGTVNMVNSWLGLLLTVLLLVWIIGSLWLLYRQYRGKQREDLANARWRRALNRDWQAKGTHIDEYEGIPQALADQLKLEDVIQ